MSAHHISHRSAHAFCVDVLGRLGVSGEEARVCAETLVEASLRGVDSHGISLLGTYAERIHSGQMRPGRRPLVRRETAGTALVDGQHGLGPPLARRAVAMAQDKAREAGLGAVALRDANYVGALATYVEAPARSGLLALAAANSTPRVAPLGGRQGLHGTNPIAWASPAEGGEPLVFDAATGHSAAKVTQAAEEGRPLAPGIGLDADGRPTTDPAAAKAGVLLPVGGILGYGFGLLVDLLTGRTGGRKPLRPSGAAGERVGRPVRLQLLRPRRRSGVLRRGPRRGGAGTRRRRPRHGTGGRRGPGPGARRPGPRGAGATAGRRHSHRRRALAGFDQTPAGQRRRPRARGSAGLNSLPGPAAGGI